MPFANRLTSLLLATFITAGTASGAVRDIDKEKWTGGASNGRPAVGDEVGILSYGSDGPVALATVDAIHEDFDGMTSDPPADSVYVAVDLTIENVGAESVTYDANDIDLVLDDGSILNSSLMSLPEEDPGPLSSDPVAPGDTTSGRVLFVVRDGAAVGGVVYDDFYNMAILAATDDFPERAPGETLNWTHVDTYYGEEYDLDVTITDAIDPYDGRAAPAGSRYIALEFTIENAIPDDGYRVVTTTFQILVDGNQLRGPIGLATTDHDPLESWRLRGGQSVTGYLIYEAPEDATTWDLIFSPLNGSYVLGSGAFAD